ERLAEGAADRGEEAAGDAGGGGRLGHRGLRAERLLPAVGGSVQAVAGQDAGAAHAELVGDRRDGPPRGRRGQLGGRAAGDLRVLGVDQVRQLAGEDGGGRRRVLAGPAGLQAQVVGVGG